MLASLSEIVDIAAGERHCLALCADGSVYAWGNNSSGQIGDGTYTGDSTFEPKTGNNNRNTPVRVKNLEKVRRIAAQGALSIALLEDGTVWEWGINTGGEAPPPDVILIPRKVDDLENVAAISAGRSRSLALTYEGVVWQWGVLEIIPDAQRKPPEIVKDVPKSIAVASGYSTYTVVAEDGTVWLWGTDYSLSDDMLRQMNPNKHEVKCIVGKEDLPEKAIKLEPGPLIGMSSWVADEVNSLNALGVIPYQLKNRFQIPIRRDEFTALMVNVYESAKGLLTTYNSPFTDIADSAYKTAIEKAKTIGLIDGTSANKFTPSGLLTREQAAKILSNVVAKIEGIDLKPAGPPDYLDSTAISDWAAGYVAYAQENKIMNGSSTGKFNPQNNLIREEAMLVAERLIVQYGW